MAIVRNTFSAVVLIAGLIAGSPAQAHPKLVSTSPQAQAQGPAPKQIELHFSESLVTQFSGAKLTMTAMPGMGTHAPMAMGARVSGSDDPKVMIITPAQPLPAGTYRVEWRAVSSDTHPVTGSFSFQVK